MEGMAEGMSEQKHQNPTLHLTDMDMPMKGMKMGQKLKLGIQGRVTGMHETIMNGKKGMSMTMECGKITREGGDKYSDMVMEDESTKEEK